MAQRAFFEGLVVDERNRPVDVRFIGDEAHYVVDDDGFLRHIEAERVDRQVLGIFIAQLREHKDLAVDQALNFLGKDDLFTKAALDASIDNVDIDQIIGQGVPDQARNMMGLMGFRIVINVHGEIVDLRQPEIADDDLD